MDTIINLINCDDVLIKPFNMSAICDSTMQNMTTLHPVNLALLQHFFSEDTVATMANTAFKNVVDVKVPNFKLYEHKMQDVLANDKIIDLSLKQVIKRTN